MTLFQVGECESVQLCSSCAHVLVGGLDHVLFFHMLGIILPTDKLNFFQRGTYTTNQCIFVHLWDEVPQLTHVLRLKLPWILRLATRICVPMVVIRVNNAWYPLVNMQKLRKITMFNGKIHYKWSCSIANCYRG
jgi:hypothetical protein